VKTYKFGLVFSALALLGLLLGGCGPAVTVDKPANGECPPGYHAVDAYEPGGELGSYCQLDNSTLPATVDMSADGECPPGYYPVYPYSAGAELGGFCQLNNSTLPETVDKPANGQCPPGYYPSPSPNGGCNLLPIPETVEMPADRECPPGYHPVYPYSPGAELGSYCQLNKSSPPEHVDMPASGECPPGYYPSPSPNGGCNLLPTPETVDLPADGECPPGYYPVYLRGLLGSYCQRIEDSAPPETVDLPADGECPPGYHLVYAVADGKIWGGYCQLNNSTLPETVDKPANGECPPGYYPSPSPNGGCILFPTLAPRAAESGGPLITFSTATPAAQALDAAIPDLKPPFEVVQYCLNKGSNLGGVNISFPPESSLHVEEWFSQSPGHVKCVDDLSNPRTCWGPESATFDVVFCNGNFIKNESYVCKTFPVTLGACTQEREHEPAPTSCAHC